MQPSDAPVSDAKRASDRSKAPIDPARRAYGPALQTLRKRGEFLRVRGGVRWSGAAFLIEGKPRHASAIDGVRFGFTITKKVGAAHERNRMRRRLKHALRSVAVDPCFAGYDFVIVARSAALNRDFDALIGDFAAAFTRFSRSVVKSKP